MANGVLAALQALRDLRNGQRALDAAAAKLFADAMLAAYGVTMGGGDGSNTGPSVGATGASVGELDAVTALDAFRYVQADVVDAVAAGGGSRLARHRPLLRQLARAIPEPPPEVRRGTTSQRVQPPPPAVASSWAASDRTSGLAPTPSAPFASCLPFPPCLITRLEKLSCHERFLIAPIPSPPPLPTTPAGGRRWCGEHASPRSPARPHVDHACQHACPHTRRSARSGRQRSARC